MSRHKLATPEDPDAQGDVTARAVLIVLLRSIHTAGELREDVPPTLLSDPASATAIAYRFGLNGVAFDLDDILSAAGSDRHFAEVIAPERSVEFFTATGGTGESREDNRDMVGVA